MINWYINLTYPLQALVASMFTWAITSMGSAVVFLFKKVNKNTMDAMLGLSAGVMLAATFWSLLSPAIEMANNLNLISWLIVSIGVLLGGLLLFSGDKIFDRFLRLDNSLRRLNEGSGIGLSIVKSMVEVHGGSISVNSILNQGSVFEVKLPNTLLDNSIMNIYKFNEANTEIELSDIYN